MMVVVMMVVEVVVVVVMTMTTVMMIMMLISDDDENVDYAYNECNTHAHSYSLTSLTITAARTLPPRPTC